MSLFDLNGRVALITGSSRGIGRAIAEEMAGHGAKVVISSRKGAACEEVAASINRLHGEGTAVAIQANIGSKADLECLVADTRAGLGSIDILVCNAAISPYMGPSGAIQDDLFAKIFTYNVQSSHWLVTMVAPEMIERGSGAIILISSIAGLRGSATSNAYGISKAGVAEMARNFAVEYGRYGVRVNCIAPGPVLTDMAWVLEKNPEMAKRASAATCLKRIGSPREIAGASVFLASDAGSFTTGHTLVVDGGCIIRGAP